MGLKHFPVLSCLVSICCSASSPSLLEVQCAPVSDGWWVKIGEMLLNRSIM